MSFEERLTASIRGVEFLLNTVDGKGGRRAIPREYPKRESGWTEDNGAILTNEQITGKLVGNDYLAKLRTLLDALNQPGTGEMVHPWWGVRTVQVGEVSHRLDNEEDGVAYVTFTVWEAGKRLFPAAAIDTAATLGHAADAANGATEQSFLDSFLTGIDNMGPMVDTFLDDLDELTRGLPTLPDQFREWTDRLMRTKDSVGALLAYPGELAREVTGIVEDVKGVVTDPIRALSVYDQVSRRWEGMRAELAITGGLPTGILSDDEAGSASSVPTIDTPTEQDAAMANGAAFTALITRASAAAAASAIASANLGSDRDFTVAQDGTVTIGQSLTGDQVNNPLSRPVVMDGVVGADRNLLLTADDLEAMANKLAAILAELAMDAVEAGESDVWRSLRDLRLAVLNDSRERGTQLPRRRQLVLTSTTPSALLAWQQYGDAEYRDRLVSNNNLRDPAFITPSTRVDVLDEVTNG
ncbi:DNA circularization protein [Aeromonas bestiarum]|uniref:DNA circularization N-terminal domain-containing protein n=1 Tax=Aeromonas bestiarum TaxID=105751 RepID=A0ABT7Q5W1_9GAMM|nr:DNA circularization N-terminal domain-containing protein [Aeromonas bestiarum]MDM5074695.1 DNA circularization N-terminal domain-containing protein [Aeromonas bestiarum]